ncbi:hypothetical protein E2C01_035320 [Portunus trituberculatus]|uniref:Uncharacterized protein n=1 Tax=Portunus trituberculatus TaxID=210409 RepID=A0A5B7F909_PORTR|nr:hypothetical protein [Portunus trituberculatus]
MSKLYARGLSLRRTLESPDLLDLLLHGPALCDCIRLARSMGLAGCRILQCFKLTYQISLTLFQPAITITITSGPQDNQV